MKKNLESLKNEMFATTNLPKSVKGGAFRPDRCLINGVSVVDGVVFAPKPGSGPIFGC